MSINVYPSEVHIVTDPWLEDAKRNILADYGDSVSLEAKNKNLIKFGRHENVQTTPTTLMTLPAGIYNETYVATNIITSVVSTAAGDTETITIEGHTISGSDLTFVTQNIALTGQTEATLATPLARATRAYNANGTELTGVISVCEDDTYVAGVPQTPAGVHLQIRAGDQQSEKCSTSLSSVDYWVVTAFYADMLEKTAASVDIVLEVRLEGKVFRKFVNVSASEGHRAQFSFAPYLVIPPNSDVRLRASASANNKDVSGGIIGALLKA